MTPDQARAAAVALRPAAVRWAASYVAAVDAEDVAHAAIAVLLERAEVIAPAAAASWLRTAVLHKAREHARARRELPAEAPERPADTPDPEDTLVSAQLTAVVREAMDRLEASRRAILDGVLLDERPLAEVAREHGIPESTGRARLEAGTEQLQQDLHRQRVREKRRTGGSSSWALLPAGLDLRAWWRRAVAALGGAAAVAAGALVYMAPEQLGQTPEEPLARAAEVEVVRLATNDAQAERGQDAQPVRSAYTLAPRARHDAAARMLTERLRRPE